MKWVCLVLIVGWWAGAWLRKRSEACSWLRMWVEDNDKLTRTKDDESRQTTREGSQLTRKWRKITRIG